MNKLTAFFRRITGRDQLTCREVVELVTNYVEGAMTAAERRRVDVHLAGCDGCTRFLEQMRRTVQLAGRVTEEDVSALPPETLGPLLVAFRAARDDGA
jgi:predicted anti-sigma-YlaC factor YlaD